MCIGADQSTYFSLKTLRRSKISRSPNQIFKQKNARFIFTSKKSEQISPLQKQKVICTSRYELSPLK